MDWPEREVAMKYMTLDTIKRVFEQNNIPDSARILSDSGWECDATDIGGIYYNASENAVVLTQHDERHYNRFEGWEKVYDFEEEDDDNDDYKEVHGATDRLHCM